MSTGIGAALQGAVPSWLPEASLSSAPGGDVVGNDFRASSQVIGTSLAGTTMALRKVSFVPTVRFRPAGWPRGAWIVIGRMVGREGVLVAGDAGSQMVAVARADVVLGLFVALE